MNTSVIFFSSHFYVFWLIITIMCIIIESLTLSLTTIWFALGAIIVLFLSFLPIPFHYQVLLFLLISAAFLCLTRPAALLLLQKNKKEKTNADALIGMSVPVTKSISRLKKGEIRYNGLYWAATGKDGIEIEAGTTCVILSIQGNTVTVTPEKGDTV